MRQSTIFLFENKIMIVAGKKKNFYNTFIF